MNGWFLLFNSCDSGSWWFLVLQHFPLLYFTVSATLDTADVVTGCRSGVKRFENTCGGGTYHQTNSGWMKAAKDIETWQALERDLLNFVS